jgi:hypothetical protein
MEKQFKIQLLNHQDFNMKGIKEIYNIEGKTAFNIWLSYLNSFLHIRRRPLKLWVLLNLV